ncbi:MAG: hypothetical protein ACI8WB_001778 [Phenylobacterium sp.]|jgi:hypothetical protein
MEIKTVTAFIFLLWGYLLTAVRNKGEIYLGFGDVRRVCSSLVNNAISYRTQ